MSGTGRSQSYNVPVSLAIGVTFGWMFACAALFCLFFETTWDYFTSFYFFFISLTTIGFGEKCGHFISFLTIRSDSDSLPDMKGDVTPTHPEYMFATSVLIIIGLSLVSMCISVVQLKLEQLFEDMMMSLMEEGDIEAPDLSAVEGGAFGLFQLFSALKKKKKKMAQKGRGGPTGEKSQRSWPSPAFSSFRLNRKHAATQTDWRDYCEEGAATSSDDEATNEATMRTVKMHNFTQTEATFPIGVSKMPLCDRTYDVATLTPVF
uniref:Potassium channel domain-containing protein n=1 Tax=Romanomermis culicivorax TaxID=13658 RepID=A0A915K224_ROMCU